MKKRQIQGTLLTISLLAAPVVLAQEAAGAGSQAPAASEAGPPAAGARLA